MARWIGAGDRRATPHRRGDHGVDGDARGTSVAHLAGMRATLALAFTCLLAAPAAHADDFPGFGWVGHGDGFKLSEEAPTARELGCPLDDTAAKRATLATFAAHANATRDPDAMRVFPEYAPRLQAWFERWVASVPQVGPWPQVQALYARATALVPKVPETSNPAFVIEHLADYSAAAELAGELERVVTVMENGPCARRFGNGNDLVWQIKRARDNAKRAAVDVMPSLQAYNFPQRPDASPPPTTYWKHLEWVKVRVEYGAGLGKLRSAVDDVRALAPLSADLAARIAELDAELAAADALVAATADELRRVRMPKQKVDAARSKLVRQSFVGWTQGAQVGLVVSVPGVAKSGWQEKVEVRRTTDKIYYRLYPTKRETYLVHEGYRPTPETAIARALPGIAADEICEIRAQEFTRYPKGPPSFKRTWHETFFGVTGFVLCANVGEMTTMRAE